MQQAAEILSTARYPQGPTQQRAIIDRRAVITRLDGVAATQNDERGAQDAAVLRKAVQAVLREVLSDGRAEIRRRFLEAGAAKGSNPFKSDGGEVLRGTAFLIDQIIRVAHDFAVAHVFPMTSSTTGDRLSIVAVGGYGRFELAPQSDIDLLFLLPYKKTPHVEQVVEWLLYLLWDLGLKVGHATRSVDECLRQAKADHTVRTSLLEARYVWGDQALFTELKRRFSGDDKDSSGLAFVDAKMAERDARHRRTGDSRYALEPDIKESKGGLRDLHSLYWIAKELYRVDHVDQLVERHILTTEEARRFAKAQSFLWALRCHLHYLTGRPNERLTFDIQPLIAQQMGYSDHGRTKGVERFMKHYFLVAKTVGDLTRIFCSAFEADRKKRPTFRLPGFSLRRPQNLGDFVLGDGDRLSIKNNDVFLRDPVNFLRLFHIAEKNGFDIHPHGMRRIRQSLNLIDTSLRSDAEANRLFIEILTATRDPEWALRQMSEAGVLGRFIPDFGRVVAQMQYDMYHVHTTDEHTLQAVGILHSIEIGKLKDQHPISSDIIHKIASRRVLYLAVLLHDIAKGRNGDHSLLGEKVAENLCPRLGLSDEETETVAWLVRWHLLMSNVAFKRDLDDPKTIADFAAEVRSLERLKLLLLLTVVDIKAVGPNVWNGWKAGLLRELYYRADEYLSGGLSAGNSRSNRIEAIKTLVRAELPELNEAEFETFAALPYPAYWSAFDPATHARHARLVREAERDHRDLTVATRIDTSRSVTEVTIYTGDHAGLFSQIAGALAVAGANIVDARIATMTNGMALDVFWVQDERGGPIDRSDRLARLVARIEQTLSGECRPSDELCKRGVIASRTGVFKVPPRVLIDNAASATHTVIEVNGRDRRGLLFDVTRALTGCGIQISSARIATYGESVIDVFYVKDIFGMKIYNDGKLAEIRKALLAALADPKDADPGDLNTVTSSSSSSMAV